MTVHWYEDGHPNSEDESQATIGMKTAGKAHSNAENRKQKTGPDKMADDRSGATKVIAVWDSLLRKAKGHLRNLPFRKCPNTTCRLLYENETFNDADVIIFNMRDNALLNRPETFPNRTRPEQLYVFFNYEAPLRVIGRLDNHVFKNVFNLTMTFRSDSDIYIPHFGVRKKSPGVPDNGALSVSDISSKRKLAIWVISHCQKPGTKRWRYGRELAKYVQLDIYGNCSGHSCPPSTCLNMAEKQYKFYISFENAICKDYVTEKLYKPLMRNMVPVALGGLDYDVTAPPRSVIDVRKFKSPRALADYLIELDGNDRKYLEYFIWKSRYEVVVRPHGLCELCQVVGDNSYSFKSHFDPYKWWVKDAQCVSEARQERQLGLL